MQFRRKVSQGGIDGRTPARHEPRSYPAVTKPLVTRLPTAEALGLSARSAALCLTGGSETGRPPTFDPDVYRRRNVIERCIGWLKHARRIAARYEKLAVNFLAMVKLAIIQRYLRILDSSDRA